MRPYYLFSVCALLLGLLSACSRGEGIPVDKTVAVNEPDSFAQFLNPIAGLPAGDYTVVVACHASAGISGVPMWWTDAQPVASTLALYEEIRARVDFNDPVKSLVLIKPSGNHHYGGLITGFDVDNPADRQHYDTILNWIMEGAREN